MTKKGNQEHLLTELPWSWHKSKGWRGQYDRMRRWHGRLRLASEVDGIEDYIYAFFQNCYHLRDWLQNAGAVRQSSIELFFRHNAEMRLCQDICNGTKHFSLTRSKFGREFSLAREYVGPSGGQLGQNATLVILVDGKKFDIFELAKTCIDLWENFLKSHDLIDA